MRLRSLLHSPGMAAVLSFLLPGLGQAASGRLRRGALIAIPAVIITVAIAVVLIFFRHDILDAALMPQWQMAILIVDLMALGYHTWAIVDAYLVAGGTFRAVGRASTTARFGAALMLAALLTTTVGIHGYIAVADASGQQAVNCITDPNGPECMFAVDATQPPGDPTVPPYADDATDTPAPPTGTPTSGPTASGTASETASDTPSSSPVGVVVKAPTYPLEMLPPSTGTATDWANDGMLNLLLIGADAGAGRWSLRTDTIILLQVDIATGRSAMYGIPRNLFNIPLAPESAAAFACHCFPQYLTAYDERHNYQNYLYGLYVYAEAHPKYFPGANGVRGFKALEGAIGQLTGVHVDGMILVNLMGFVHLVDALGGVDMNTPYRVQTLKAFPYPDADGSGHTALNIAAGQHHFNGAMALAYARVRHVIGYDSDYYRMSRQQLVIKALRDNLNPCALLSRISSVITSLGGTFWTDMPKADASKLAGLASKIAGTNVKSYTFTPSNGYAEYLTVDRVNKIRNAVAHGLDGVPAGSGSGGGGGGGVGC